MTVFFRNIVLPAAVVAIGSLIVCFVISAAVVPLLGGRLEGAGLLMTLTLPVVIGFPASAFQFWQFERLRRVKEELATALLKLDDLNEELAETNDLLAADRTHDGMTRLLNFDGYTSAILQSAQRTGNGQLMLIKIDAFPNFIRDCGPIGEDIALVAVAGAIRQACRQGDLAARVGHDEFSIFMPRSTPMLAALAASSLSVSVSGMSFNALNGSSTLLTLSIGGVECPPGFDLGETLRTCAQKLSEALAQGGNCSVMAKQEALVGISRF
jgi:diguanylate cyclase (GGDEF)-like protein